MGQWGIPFQTRSDITCVYHTGPGHYKNHLIYLPEPQRKQGK